LESITLFEGLESIEYSAFKDCKNLKKIIIPKSVVTINYDSFDNCTSLTIYCRTASIPDGWDEGWNDAASVVWGYTGD
jgi:hypothetical protein